MSRASCRNAVYITYTSDIDSVLHGIPMIICSWFYMKGILCARNNGYHVCETFLTILMHKLKVTYVRVPSVDCGDEGHTSQCSVMSDMFLFFLHRCD
jgi:hypothetical protein